MSPAQTAGRTEPQEARTEPQAEMAMADTDMDTEAATAVTVRDAPPLLIQDMQIFAECLMQAIYRVQKPLSCRCMRGIEPLSGTSLWAVLWYAEAITLMLRNILIQLALLIRIITNTERRRTSFADVPEATEEGIEPHVAAVEAAALYAVDLCARIAAVSALAAIAADGDV